MEGIGDVQNDTLYLAIPAEQKDQESLTVPTESGTDPKPSSFTW